MVVFVDLDDHLDEVEHHQHQHGHTATPFDMRDLINAHATRPPHHPIEERIETEEEDTEQDHPNLNALSAVLGNYPFVIHLKWHTLDLIQTNQKHHSIISEIATHLDLNSLHDLSRTCRQFRANLLQHRKQLIPHTLRCISDISASSRKPEGKGEGDAWVTHGPAGIRIPRLTSGKFGACARDMVGECRRCGTVVCRVSLSSLAIHILSKSKKLTQR
jgi:hypothetical protein